MSVTRGLASTCWVTLNIVLSPTHSGVGTWADETVWLPAGGAQGGVAEANGGHFWKGLWALCTGRHNK